MRIGFTGTQKGMTLNQVRVVTNIVEQSNIDYAHHGDCIGADEQFHLILFNCKKYSNPDLKVVIHPPEKSVKRAFCAGAYQVRPKKEYLARNLDIIKETEMLIATPKEFQNVLRSGTWSTIRKAIKAKKHVVIIFPDGSIKRYN